MTTMSLYKKLLILLGVLAILSPLGLIASGDAWGEWSKEELAKMLGYIPYGLKRFADFWSAPFSDYTIKGTNDTIGYIASAIIGSLLVMLLMYVVGKILAKNK
ncbi:PDGLE domain-containing protein [Hippea alviniae]|uniref:PDGLE domain-containing protein n=1 Tax=Hippea alviniae TaxID=1279027 RepID=UPI0004225C37|nr:PDGLE domain-containing protein [Hippea alviniae]